MGVWIETIQVLDSINLEIVTPYVGVWIETIKEENNFVELKSHPTWVCGLKRLFLYPNILVQSHTLRGCVD